MYEVHSGMVVLECRHIALSTSNSEVQRERKVLNNTGNYDIHRDDLPAYRCSICGISEAHGTDINIRISTKK